MNYPKWFTSEWFEIWTNDGSIIAILVSAIISILTLIYIASTFHAQRDLSSITIAKNSYDVIIKNHKKLYIDITTNDKYRDDPKHVQYKYDYEKLTEYLNELELICLLVKSGSMKPSIAFEMLRPMLIPCISDPAIKNRYNKNAYTNINEVSQWCEKYYAHTKIFNLRYALRWFGLL